MKKAVVVHSGGMDSSLCLALAVKKYGKENVVSLSFAYSQRHSTELIQAAKICASWDIDHVVLQINCLPEITSNALTNIHVAIEHQKNNPPNTMVVGRNGLMARLAAIYAQNVGAHCIYMGVMGLEGAHSGYRDCSREYMDLKQQILQIDLDDPSFEICTPLVALSKKESLKIAADLGVLSFLLEETISCYEGISREGCRKCPACLLRNQGIKEYLSEYSDDDKS